MKRWISFFLAVVMTLSLVAGAAAAMAVDNTIYTVYLNYTQPEVGAAVDNTVTVPAGANYRVAKSQWYDAFTFEPATRFEDGRSYYNEVEIIPLDGYEIDLHAEAYANNRPVDLYRNYDTYAVELEVSFGKILEEVSFTYDAPVVGGSLDTAVTYPEDAGYTVSVGEWYRTDVDGIATSFEAGQSYTNRFRVNALPGYAFDGDEALYAYANGEILETYLTSSAVAFFDVTVNFGEYIYSVSLDIQPAEVGKPVDNTVTIPQDAHYSVQSACWMEADTEIPATVFEQGKAYSMHVKLVPHSGYSFYKNMAVNGPEGYSAGWSTSSRSLWAHFDVDFSERISQVSFTYPEPILGGAVDNSITVDADAAYDVVASQWREYGTDQLVTTFEQGKLYYNDVRIKAKAGSKFSAYYATKVVANGKEYSGESYADDMLEVRIFADYAQHITSMTLSCKEPALGNIPVDYFSVPEDAGYYISNLHWQECDTGVTANRFEDGKLYEAYVYFVPKAGFSFPEDSYIEITVNGKTQKVWSDEPAWLYVREYADFTEQIDTVSFSYTEPQVGQRADSTVTIPQNATYTVTVEPWHYVYTEEPVDTFATGDFCEMYVTLQAKPGFSFVDEEFLCATANGDEIMVDWSDKTECRFCICVDLANWADSISFTYQEPAVGAKVNNTLTLPEDALYEVAASQWIDGTTGQPATTFQKGRWYYNDVTIKTKEGSMFSSYEIEVTVNGETEWMELYDYHTFHMRLTADFLEYIDRVALTYKEPTAGATVDNKVTVPSGANYTVDAGKWCELGTQTPVSTFQKGKRYSKIVKIKPASGYGFMQYEQVEVCMNEDYQWIQATERDVLEVELFADLTEKLTSLSITYKEPTVGSKVDNTVTLPKGAKYTVVSSQWCNMYTDEPVTEYKKGEKYYNRIMIQAASGYGFEPYWDIAVTVNGQTEYIQAYDYEYAEIVVNADFTQKLNQVSVSVKTPKAGQAVDNTVTLPSGAQYGLNTEYDGPCWYEYQTYEPTATFQKGSMYIMRFSLVPKPGYSFDQAAEVTVTGIEDAHVYVEPDVISVELVADFTEKIDTVNIFYTEPKAGQAVDNTVTVPKDAKYSVLQSQWFDEETHEPVTVFEKGGTYFISVELEPLEGYGFVTDVPLVAYVNGQKTETWVYDYSRCNLTQSVDLREKIQEVSITYTPAKSGAKPKNTATVPVNAPYRATIAQWYLKNAEDYTASTSAFKTGKVYAFAVELEAQEGYAYTDDLRIYINGKKTTALHSEVWGGSLTLVIMADLRTPISSVTVPSFPEVEPGQTFETVVQEKSGYTITTQMLVDHGEGFQPVRSAVKNGTVYLMCMTVTGTTKAITKDTKIILDGKEAEGYFDEENLAFVITKTMAVGLTPIDTVEIFADPPEEGKPFGEITFAKNSPYYAERAKWIDSTTAQFTNYGYADGNTFTAGKYYALGLVLTAERGYYFTDDLKITINGQEAELLPQVCMLGTTAQFFVDMTNVEPNSAPMADFNADGSVNNEDVAYLLWHTLFPEDYPISGNADYNDDGNINNEDVAYLLWHTLFPEDYPI